MQLLILHDVVSTAHSGVFLCVCLRCWVEVQVEGLVGKVAGIGTMIAASERGLHRFPLSSCTCHYGITDATSTFSIQQCSTGQSLQNTSTLTQAESSQSREVPKVVPVQVKKQESTMKAACWSWGITACLEPAVKSKIRPHALSSLYGLFL